METSLNEIPAGEKIADRYRVIKVLGRGGMGIVYLAWDEWSAKPCAVKMIIPDWLDNPRAISEIADRFDTEIAILSKISHPCIVSCTDSGRHGPSQLPFFVMDYIEGQAADDYMEMCRTPEDRLQKAEAILWQLLDALGYVHQMGLIHRDLKPSNLLICPTIHGPHLKVLDFGLAKARQALEAWKDPKLTSNRVQIGTEYYMSPEQCLNARKATAASDIYSCGIIACELMCGQYPYPEKGENDNYLEQHLHAQVDEARLRSVLPDYAVEFILLCLRKNPSERPMHGYEAQAIWKSLRENGPAVLPLSLPDDEPETATHVIEPSRQVHPWQLALAAMVFACLVTLAWWLTR